MKFAANSEIFLKDYVGRFFEITNLTSEKGSQLNGKVGKVIGYEVDSWRLQIKIDNDDTIYKIKWENTFERKDIISAKKVEKLKKEGKYINGEKGTPKKLIKKSGQTFKELLPRFISEVKEAPQRYDIVVRSNQVKLHLAALENEIFSQFLKCGDFEGIQIEEGSFIEKLIKAKKPCAGDRKFRLPEIYNGDVKRQQAVKRLCEWIYTGMCIACQVCYLETQSGVYLLEGRDQGQINGKQDKLKVAKQIQQSKCDEESQNVTKEQDKEEENKPQNKLEEQLNTKDTMVRTTDNINNTIKTVQI